MDASRNPTGSVDSGVDQELARRDRLMENIIARTSRLELMLPEIKHQVHEFFFNELLCCVNGLLCM